MILDQLRLYFIVFISLLYVGPLFSQDSARNSLVLSAAELTINGETNVNSFSCALRKTHINDTLLANKGSEEDLNSFEGMEISFRVEDFECGLEMMTQDFRELLKAESHPQIIMRIEEIIMPEGCGKNYSGPVQARVKLFIANAERKQLIDEASIHQIRQKTIFTGNHQVLMTSFNIDPPTRLFGAVKAKDQLQIHFAIQIQES